MLCTLWVNCQISPSNMATTESNSRHNNRLSLILKPSPPLSAVSHGQPKPVFRRSASINYEGHSRDRPVKTQRQSLQLSPPTPPMHPLLSSPATPDRSLAFFPRARGGPGPLMSQQPQGKSHTSQPPHQRSRTTSAREKQAMESPKLKRLSPDLFLPTPAELRKHPRPLRDRRPAKHRASVDVTPAMGWIKSADGVRQKQVIASPTRTHKIGRASADNGVPDSEVRPDPVRPLSVPLPEKQRVMNVRRAKKMQQVRGGYGSDLFLYSRGLETLIPLRWIVGFRLRATVLPFPGYTRATSSERDYGRI